MINVSDSYTFKVDQQSVWALLMNPDAIAKAIPGVKELIPVEGEAMTWRAAAKVGFVSLSGQYAGIIKVSEVDAPHQYRLTIKGEGQQSFIGGTALITLAYDVEKNETLVRWDGQVEISGTLVNLGPRLIAAGASALSQQFFQDLGKQLPLLDEN